MLPSHPHSPLHNTDQLMDTLTRQAALLAAVRDAVIAVDQNYVITDWNRGAEELYGFTAEEALGQRMDKLILNNMSTEEVQDAGRIAYNTGVWRGRSMQRHKNGKWMYIDSVVSPLLDKAGQLNGFIGINRDITEQAQAEERFYKAFHATPAILAIISLETGKILDINESGERFTGYRREEIVGHTADELGHRLYGEQNESLLRQFQEQGFIRDTELRVNSKDGQLRYCLLSMEEIQVNNEQSALIILVDITPLKETATSLQQVNTELQQRVAQRTGELQNRQAELAALLDAMGDGVIYTLGEQVQYMNRAMTELSGYQLDELIDKPAQWLLGKELGLIETQKRTSEILRMLQDGRAWRGEGKLTRKDSSRVDVAYTVNALLDGRNDIIGSVILVRDITEEKQLQERKMMFLTNASHELRTPLTNIKTRVYLLQKQPERFKDHMEVLEKVTSQMANLVNDLLNVSRFESGVISLQKREIVLQTVLDTVIRVQQVEAEMNRICLTTHVPKDPITLNADPDRLLQVVVNLVVNAINYTSVGGKVDVWLDTEQQAGKQQAIIRVTDTGIGIEAQHLERLFEPFYRVSEGTVTGTGLGLPIAHSIVELHGGTISVESVVGQGTTFTVLLPME